MKVIGTAGHIDHGKSALVEALTGTDPDRLAEEKRRGMTIDLGFAALRLPSDELVSIVDVPGHERFVRTMLAGAGGVDIALIVVAVNDGVMPQTREHVNIVNLLGIRSAVVALTKTDLVDDEWIALMREEVRDLLAGTPLAGSEIIPVSSVTGAGIKELVAELDRLQAVSPGAPTRHAAYLPIDRVFTIAGFGTVVTGTLHGGSLQTGMELEVLPEGARAKVRGLQSHHRSQDSVVAGMRVAVNLTGIDRDRLSCGDVLAPVGAIGAVRRFDAQIRVLDDCPIPLRHSAEVMLHIGSAECRATVSILSGPEVLPGAVGWAQLRVRERIVAVRDQRFILRLPAPARTIAGGEVIDLAPRHRRLDRDAVARLAGMRTALPSARLAAILSDHRPRTVHQLGELSGLANVDLRTQLDVGIREGCAVRHGDTYLSVGAWEETRARVSSLLHAYHDQNPLTQGMPRQALRRLLRVRQSDWPATLEMLAASGILIERGPVLAAPGWLVGIAARRAEADLVLTTLRAHPFSPPSGAELLALTSTDVGLLSALANEGEIVRIADGLYLDAQAYARMCSVVTDLIVSSGAITVAGVRDALGTTRKYALALLEHLDDERITRRQGDVRVLGSKRPACV